MATSRRNFVFFLGIGGASVAALTGAGFLYRAVDRGSFSDLQSGQPFEPWHEWRHRQMSDIEGVALAGTLASSFFNTQPWLLRLYGDVIDLFFNRRATTPLLDPYFRSALIGLGACIENMVTGAEGLGLSASVTLFPDREDHDHIARLTLAPSKPRQTPRFLAIGNRHTNRSAYEPGQLPPPDVMPTLLGLAPGSRAHLDLFPAASPKGRYFAESVLLAARASLEDPAMLIEQFRWFRQTMTQVQTTKDGLSFIGTGLTDLQVRTAMALPTLREDDYATFMLDQTRTVQLPNSALFGVLTVDNADDPAQMLEAGRLLQRLHLEATAQGLALQALSYPNWMADREIARRQAFSFRGSFTGRIATLAGGRGTMVLGLRMGYATRPARATSRRPLPYVLLPRAGSVRAVPNGEGPGPR
ncbi:hypothetical protein [Pedomonas sp. V897]|uniref:hypothetical protein n=1 Tax=Pedomonas sp. V897 TaxID=3446482 RepID=UPI003EDEC942